MSKTTLVQFTATSDTDTIYSFERNESEFIILNNETKLYTILTHVDLNILYYGIASFLQKVNGEHYFGFNNIENVPFTINVNGKYSLVVHKGTIDNYTKQFTAGSVSADGIEFTSIPSWKIELVRNEDCHILGTSLEKSYKFLPCTTPVIFTLLSHNIEKYVEGILKC